MEETILEGSPFAPPGLLLQDQPLPGSVMVSGHCLFCFIISFSCPLPFVWEW